MPKILLVEDDLDTAEMVRLMLESAEHEVVIAANEEDTFHDVIAAHIDLVVLDLSVIRNRQGFTALVESANIPIILCSAANEHPPEYAKVLTYRLPKPFDPSQLLELVRRAIDSKR